MCCYTGTQDDTKKKKYREKISEYMARAEELKQHVKDEKEGRTVILSQATSNRSECFFSLNFTIICSIPSHNEHVIYNSSLWSTGK